MRGRVGERDDANTEVRERELERRVALLERAQRRWIALALSALTAASGSIVAVGKGIYDRGAREGAAEIRLQHVEHEVLRLRKRGDRRRSERPMPVWPNPSAVESKGHDTP